MTYSIIVCDDDLTLAKDLASKIEIAFQNMADDNPNYGKVSAQVKLVAHDYAQVVNFIKQKKLRNGIYFLDIELSQKENAKNGVDLAEEIKKSDPNAQIIFVTAYDKYAPLTYRRRIGAIDYINKEQPRKQIIARLEETLKNAIDDLVDAQKFEVKDLIYRIGRRVEKVPQTEIYYIESSDIQHKVKMITATGESEFKATISHLAEENSFLFKVSQSYLVNPQNIVAFDLSKRIITFPNGDQISFSRDKRKAIIQIINQYHANSNN